MTLIKSYQMKGDADHVVQTHSGGNNIHCRVMISVAASCIAIILVLLCIWKTVQYRRKHRGKAMHGVPHQDMVSRETLVLPDGSYVGVTKPSERPSNEHGPHSGLHDQSTSVDTRMEDHSPVKVTVCKESTLPIPLPPDMVIHRKQDVSTRMEQPRPFTIDFSDASTTSSSVSSSSSSVDERTVIEYRQSRDIRHNRPCSESTLLPPTPNEGTTRYSCPQFSANVLLNLPSDVSTKSDGASMSNATVKPDQCYRHRHPSQDGHEDDDPTSCSYSSASTTMEPSSLDLFDKSSGYRPSRSAKRCHSMSSYLTPGRDMRLPSSRPYSPVSPIIGPPDTLSFSTKKRKYLSWLG